MDTINTLRQLRDKLLRSQTEALDTETFTELGARIAGLDAEITVEANQARKQLADQAATERQTALDVHASRQADLARLQQEQVTLDAQLFELLGKVWETFEADYATGLATTKMADELVLEARNLELPQEYPQALHICGMAAMKVRSEVLVDLLAQYGLASNQLSNHKARGLPDLPDKVEQAWFHKGDGRYWPRPPVPPPPIGSHRPWVRQPIIGDQAPVKQLSQFVRPETKPIVEVPPAINIEPLITTGAKPIAAPTPESAAEIAAVITADQRARQADRPTKQAPPPPFDVHEASRRKRQLRHPK